MSTQAEERSQCAPPPTDAQRAIRWLCTNNPFYAISAGLFLAGLWLSFGNSANAEDVWGLMSGFAAYTLLLAGTAYLLVRFAHVWDDARTVMLLVVLMFLATSVTFDEVLVFTPRHGIACYLVGFVFAVAVSEGILHGTRLVLPMLYRGPYYLILALFFGYPLVLRMLMNLDPNNPSSEPLMWGIFGFSTVAGLAFLTLLPAIRQGAAYVRDNGSPWPWPLYPWTLFGLLAFAVPGRAVLLCWSMHLIGVRDIWEVMFGAYFLVPFGFVAAVLLLEAGLTTHRHGVQAVALLLPPLLVLLIPLGHHTDPAYTTFLNIFKHRLHADPVLLTLLASVAFYGYAALRGVRPAIEAMTAALIVLVIVRPELIQWGDAETPRFVPQLVPLLAAAVLQLGLGAWRFESWRCLLGSLILAGSIAFTGDPESARLRWIVAEQLTVLPLLVLGAIFADPLGKTLRWAGGGLALLLCLRATFFTFDLPPGIEPWMRTAYPPAMAVVLAGYAWWLRHPPSYVIASLVLVSWFGVFGWDGYRGLRDGYIRGLDYIMVSLTLFAVALAISLGKAGLLSRWLAAWRAKAPEG